MTRMKHRLIRSFILVMLASLLAATVLAFEIWHAAAIRSSGNADAALVLGAAVVGSVPSPVLMERLRHAKLLYESARIKRILVTGGRSPEDQLSEAEASRNWLVANGVPPDHVLVEGQSRTTVENLTNAKPMLAEHDFTTVLIVSDPLHMYRAALIARSIGIAGESSPTSTSRYRTWRTVLPFLARETWFTAQYLVLGL